MLFGGHVLLWLVGSSVIWSLNAPTTDKQFDTLLWLIILSVHGLVAYRTVWLAFVFHLLMCSAGTATIMAIPALVWWQRLLISLLWLLGGAMLGLILYRGWLHRQVTPPRPPRPPRPLYDDNGSEEYVPPV